ncbi:MAG: aminotransferase class I/II-fold pyridoxal phosphate-dependent enzyme [Desulfobacterales bacterium]|uniref:Aminotransferase class I/II-fold pyridoxal phosphate-dependent enzyme n=1 Tax=Candidatus Desulfatibia profunda TaxID=2841695 RepID=A0A8J6NQM2_9BACT|nr:aminotransferase class I/II-fold pyridoxal phosphate-dependent enzyme [Candidatus Desulfatibia profunda]MBL7196445.1 aminotransferase class I/II-fold pyridoxal phosphate-dependent enzyme [Desulfobacterales bacterium]
MKVFIDTNVLIDVAVRADQFPDSLKLINDIIEWDEGNLWISAISLNNLEHILSRLGHKEKARNFLKFIQQTFSIIPFRRSVFTSALAINTPDFEDGIQMASAGEMGMDYIITRNTDDFKDSKVPTLTPTEFLEKWNGGEFDSATSVPFLDLKAQHHQVYNEIDDKITDIIANTGFILGKHVEEFEERFTELQGAKYCIGVSSGTDALHVALLALGIGPGDKVIVPVNTFIATAEAVSLCGGEPVFVDCDKFYNLDTEKLKLKRTEVEEEQRGLLKAIIPVHLYGQPANMAEIMALANEYGIEVVEDCCQAHLGRYQEKSVGGFGKFGAFSFYPGKNLGAYGEAGALITNDEKLYQRAKMIRQHGEIERYHHQVIGHNYRMEAFQGAVLATKSKYLTEWTEKRRANAELYSELLEDVEGIETPQELDETYCVYHLYVIQCDKRDDLKAYLEANGISTGLHYPVPLHMQPAYAFLGYKEGDFPVAETAAKRILSLPMYPELAEAQIRYICDKIKEFCK